MRRRRGRALLLAISLVLQGACGSSREQELHRLREELASWDATARLTAELSRRGALPSVYVRQVSEVVVQGRARVHQQAARLSP